MSHLFLWPVAKEFFGRIFKAFYVIKQDVASFIYLLSILHLKRWRQYSIQREQKLNLTKVKSVQYKSAGALFWLLACKSVQPKPGDKSECSALVCIFPVPCTHKKKKKNPKTKSPRSTLKRKHQALYYTLGITQSTQTKNKKKNKATQIKN